MTFEYKSLDQLGTISRGRSQHRPRNDPQLFGGKYPFIQTADVKNAPFYISDYSNTYNETGLNQSKLWPAGTLCITIAANIADTGILKIPACFPDSIMGFLPYENISDVRYIKYCFDILKREFQQISQGTAQDNLSWEKLSKIKFPVPDYIIQCRIADILSAYDDLIEVNQKQIRLLEEAARRLYKEWFVDLRFPGHENTSITDGIPAGWKKTSLNEIAQFSRGKTITQKQTISGDIPVIAGGLEPAYYHNTSNTEAPVITVSASGANAGFTQIHYQKIWASDCSFTDDTTTSHLYFVYCFLKQNHNLMSNLQKGSAQPHVYAKDINKLPLLLPPQTLICKFEEAVTSFFHTSENCLAKIKLAAEARNRLLPKLMSGEIEV